MLLAIWIGWEVLDAWGNLEFATSKWPAVRSAFLAAWIATTGPLTADRIQWIVLLAGLSWVVVAAMREPKTKARELPPKESASKAQVDAAEALLRHALSNGIALANSNDWHLVMEWSVKTKEFIREAFGSTEGERFFTEETVNRARSLTFTPGNWLHERTEAVRGLGMRLTYTPVLSSFDHIKWERSWLPND